MAKGADYCIVIPSRARAENMDRMRSLVPTGIVLVDEAEHDAYAQFVPKEKLWTHPGIKGILNIRNWVLDQRSEECVVMIDDDLDYVRTLVQRYVQIRDAEMILAIVENALVSARDLDAGVFCWSRSGNRVLAKPELKPFRPTGLAGSTWGIRGPARDRRFDNSYVGRADAEFTLRTLRDDRFLLYDNRFYFHHGKIFSGKGGNVGLVKKHEFDASTERLKNMYGPYISMDPKEGKSSSGMTIKVRRTNPGSSTGVSG